MERGVDGPAAESSESNGSDTPLPESETPWLQQAIAQVEAHLGDDGYSVEQLASDLCMSRMTFYRKIQSATGQKPTEFIRTIRLRRAAELLREGRMTVTEVSYATGFSSVSYFSRCFRAMFGAAPTNFSKTA
jgi:transcriptional regulator GlxA family with amidase domain